jgi:hypothetical protein
LDAIVVLIGDPYVPRQIGGDIPNSIKLAIAASVASNREDGRKSIGGFEGGAHKQHSQKRGGEKLLLRHFFSPFLGVDEMMDVCLVNIRAIAGEMPNCPALTGRSNATGEINPILESSFIFRGKAIVFCKTSILPQEAIISLSPGHWI